MLLLKRIAAAVVITAVLVVVAILFQLSQLSSRPLVLDEPIKFEVQRGTGLSQLARRLQSEGLIEQLWSTRLYARLHDLEQILAGEYLISPGDTIDDLLQRLNRGDVVEYQIVFPEGTSYREWLAKMAQTEQLVSSGEVDLTEVDSQLKHPEGWFFPDTYYFRKGDRDIDLLKRAYSKTRQVLEQEWQNRVSNLPYVNAYEALIMASIIEKETGDPSERDEIAGVFVRRMQKGMKLQTDPTVIYGLGDSYTGNITRKHLRQSTPYNTYVHKGLPPTPIAMPGQEAIYAALHPKPGRSLYFVAKGDGSHYFSETLDEHNRAVKRYQLRRKKDYRSSPVRQ